MRTATATATCPPDGFVPSKRVYTTTEVATIAGRHPDTILAAVARGEFPKPLRKLGGRYQWARDVIDAYFAGADIRTATATPAARTAATAG